MNNVTDIDSLRPHCSKLVKCDCCEHQWVAVYPVGITKGLECPNCYQTVNEYGIPILVRCCKECGATFTVCPKPTHPDNWEYCMSEKCKSYDRTRDADEFFRKGFIVRDDET